MKTGASKFPIKVVLVFVVTRWKFLVLNYELVQKC